MPRNQVALLAQVEQRHQVLNTTDAALGIILASELCLLFRARNNRHGFACHALLRWCREGADLNAKLPVLSTYMGHRSLAGTQRYLHLIAELHPEITARGNAAFGDVIPRRIES